MKFPKINLFQMEKTVIPTVLLACGSFNPITNMHLRMFELARDYLNKHTNFHVFSGIISPVSDLYPTSKQLISAKHRCEMAKRALVPFKGQQHWVKVCTWESEQNEWFRTCRVLKYQIELHNKNNENICVKLLCGSDLFETFNVPNLWCDEDIEFLCKNGIIVIARDGYDPFKTLNQSEKSSILLKYKKSIHIVYEKVHNAISSTSVREAISNGESIRYLVQDPVVQYIEEYNLYK